MARYQHLPLYQLTFALVREIYRLKLKLPNALKHDLGSMLFASSLRCIRCVVLANGSEKKSRYLQEYLLEIEMLWTLSRLLYDLRGISKGEFQLLSERIADLGPQVSAWLKWEKKRLKEAEEKAQN